MRDSEIFDKAMAQFFTPIAQELGLSLCKMQDGVYDIPSTHFIMRIRLHTGHRRGLNVLLRPASLRDFDENKPGSELGIGCFIEFHGEDLNQTFIDVDSTDDFMKQAQLLALATRHFVIPYLLGQGKDYESVIEMVRKKTEADVKEIEKYRFPKNVREEWPLPED